MNSVTIEQAARAQRSFADLDLRERARLLRRLRRAIVARRDEIVRTITEEQGKPRFEALVMELFPVLDMASHLIEQAPRVLKVRPADRHQPFLQSHSGCFAPRPYGLWAVISPWNYPFSIPMISAITFAMGGNGVVLKPSPVTPRCADLIVQLFEEAGFPDGLISVQHGGAEVAQQLIDDDHIAAVCFTGSVEGGRSVMAQCAKAPKKALLELGGKDAAIVLADADLERAAKGIAWASMANAGQTCASIERCLVERPVYDRFVDWLAREIEQIRLGDPFDESTDMGPLTTQAQFDIVRSHIEQATSQGAKAIVGGKPRSDLGERYFEPTLITDAPLDCDLMQKETFGPAVSVRPFDDLAEATEIANGAPFGLTASVWTKSQRAVLEIAARLETGVVSMNTHMTTYGEANSAWGGFKRSGIGRTHGHYGLLEGVQTQYIDIDEGGKPEIWWYPYGERAKTVVDDLFMFLSESSWPRRIAVSRRFLPQLGFLSRFFPLHRMMPKLLKYL